MSPTVIPRTPPSGLLNAVMRPMIKISMTAPGTSPLAKRDANSQNFIESRSLSNGNKWSEFISRRPRTPRRDVGKFWKRSSCLWQRLTGRQTGSLNLSNVRLVPGATSAPSWACPRTNLTALAAHLSTSPVRSRRLLLALKIAACLTCSGAPTTPTPLLHFENVLPTAFWEPIHHAEVGEATLLKSTRTISTF